MELLITILEVTAAVTLVCAVLGLPFAIAGGFASLFSNDPKHFRPAPAYDSRTIMAVWKAIRKARMEAFAKHHPVLFLSWTTARLLVVLSPVLIVVAIILSFAH